jgi:hypothetical protein
MSAVHSLLDHPAGVFAAQTAKTSGTINIKPNTEMLNNAP